MHVAGIPTCVIRGALVRRRSSTAYGVNYPRRNRKVTLHRHTHDYRVYMHGGPPWEVGSLIGMYYSTIFNMA